VVRQLRATLRVESGREILAALLAPTTIQSEALKGQEGWVQEARDFLRATLGLSVKTRGKTWSALADELWRYVLFSEFVFDLPVALPDTLKGVPHAPMEARPIVEDVCDRLRSDPKSRAMYIERAETTETELNLTDLCGAIEDLGERDTFPFEERTFLRTAIKGIVSGDTDATRRVLTRHKSSVWLGKGESQAQWELVRSGLSLVEACDDFERQLPDHARSQAELIDFYLGSLREADRLQREFEQAAGAPPAAELKEQHFSILYGDTGYSYESILGPYLQGAKAVVIEDPYIRLQHQIQNFVRFCETVLKAGTVKKSSLITGYDDKTQLADIAEKLNELKQSLLELDVELEVKLNPNIHDREIRLDNGWIIKIGRGLDFYQKPGGWFEVGANDLGLRKCLETKVDIFRA
jgi:hypothetical protein